MVINTTNSFKNYNTDHITRILPKEKEGCMEFIQDTVEYQKEWILQSQKKGLCQCDESHMFDCKNTNVAMEGGSDMEVVLESMAKESRVVFCFDFFLSYGF